MNKSDLELIPPPSTSAIHRGVGVLKIVDQNSQTQYPPFAAPLRSSRPNDTHYVAFREENSSPQVTNGGSSVSAGRRPIRSANAAARHEQGGGGGHFIPVSSPRLRPNSTRNAVQPSTTRSPTNYAVNLASSPTRVSSARSDQPNLAENVEEGGGVDTACSPARRASVSSSFIFHNAAAPPPMPIPSSPMRYVNATLSGQLQSNLIRNVMVASATSDASPLTTRGAKENYSDSEENAGIAMATKQERKDSPAREKSQEETYWHNDSSIKDVTPSPPKASRSSKLTMSERRRLVLGMSTETKKSSPAAVVVAASDYLLKKGQEAARKEVGSFPSSSALSHIVTPASEQCRPTEERDKALVSQWSTRNTAKLRGTLLGILTTHQQQQQQQQHGAAHAHVATVSPAGEVLTSANKSPKHENDAEGGVIHILSKHENTNVIPKEISCENTQNNGARSMLVDLVGGEGTIGNNNWKGKRGSRSAVTRGGAITDLKHEKLCEAAATAETRGNRVVRALRILSENISVYKDIFELMAESVHCMALDYAELGEAHRGVCWEYETKIRSIKSQCDLSLIETMTETGMLRRTLEDQAEAASAVESKTQLLQLKEAEIENERLQNAKREEEIAEARRTQDVLFTRFAVRNKGLQEEVDEVKKEAIEHQRKADELSGTCQRYARRVYQLEQAALEATKQHEQTLKSITVALHGAQRDAQRLSANLADVRGLKRSLEDDLQETKQHLERALAEIDEGKRSHTPRPTFRFAEEEEKEKRRLADIAIEAARAEQHNHQRFGKGNSQADSGRGKTQQTNPPPPPPKPSCLKVAEIYEQLDRANREITSLRQEVDLCRRSLRVNENIVQSLRPSPLQGAVGQRKFSVSQSNTNKINGNNITNMSNTLNAATITTTMNSGNPRRISTLSNPLVGVAVLPIIAPSIAFTTITSVARGSVRPYPIIPPEPLPVFMTTTSPVIQTRPWSLPETIRRVKELFDVWFTQNARTTRSVELHTAIAAHFLDTAALGAGGGAVSNGNLPPSSTIGGTSLSSVPVVSTVPHNASEQMYSLQFNTSVWATHPIIGTFRAILQERVGMWVWSAQNAFIARHLTRLSKMGPMSFADAREALEGALLADGFVEVDIAPVVRQFGKSYIPDSVLREYSRARNQRGGEQLQQQDAIDETEVPVSIDATPFLPFALDFTSNKNNNNDKSENTGIGDNDSASTLAHTSSYSSGAYTATSPKTKAKKASDDNSVSLDGAVSATFSANRGRPSPNGITGPAGSPAVVTSQQQQQQQQQQRTSSTVGITENAAVLALRAIYMRRLQSFYDRVDSELISFVSEVDMGFVPSSFGGGGGGGGGGKRLRGNFSAAAFGTSKYSSQHPSSLGTHSITVPETGGVGGGGNKSASPYGSNASPQRPPSSINEQEALACLKTALLSGGYSGEEESSDLLLPACCGSDLLAGIDAVTTDKFIKEVFRLCRVQHKAEYQRVREQGHRAEYCAGNGKLATYQLFLPGFTAHYFWHQYTAYPQLRVALDLILAEQQQGGGNKGRKNNQANNNNNNNNNNNKRTVASSSSSPPPPSPRRSEILPLSASAANSPLVRVRGAQRGEGEREGPLRRDSDDVSLSSEPSPSSLLLVPITAAGGGANASSSAAVDNESSNMAFENVKDRRQRTNDANERDSGGGANNNEINYKKFTRLVKSYSEAAGRVGGAVSVGMTSVSGGVVGGGGRSRAGAPLDGEASNNLNQSTIAALASTTVFSSTDEIRDFVPLVLFLRMYRKVPFVPYGMAGGGRVEGFERTF